MGSSIRQTVLATLAIAAHSAGPLPRLNIAPASLTISGISSGADLAAHFAVAYSDITSGAAIFAGEPWLCAVTRFPGEPVFTCAAAEAKIGSPGPGCAGLPTGFAPCEGCGSDGNTTVLYDHCKSRGPGALPLYLDVPTLAGAAAAAARADLIAPLAGLSAMRTYLYRGALDSCYLDGAVNFTAAFFSAFAADPASQVVFVANVPSGHCTPTIDPWVPRASCGHGAGAPPAVENCDYDGAGAAFAHMYGALAPPPSHACGADCAARALPFNQTLYQAGVWAALGSTGYVYVPAACAGGAACRLHVALHGCGMSMYNPKMNTSYVLHAGFNPWAESNGIVVLYPQGGGYEESGTAAPTPQLGAGCFDGYGQTSPDFAWRSAPQLATLRAMVAALAGF
jgi:poly(3-hydroxybutyrate) depolymerase